MKMYAVVKTMRIGEGVVQLTDSQARDRTGKIRPREDGAYDVLYPIEFKVGEVLGVEALPKHLGVHVTDLEAEGVSQEAAKQTGGGAPPAPPAGKPARTGTKATAKKKR